MRTNFPNISAAIRTGSRAGLVVSYRRRAIMSQTTAGGLRKIKLVEKNTFCEKNEEQKNMSCNDRTSTVAMQMQRIAALFTAFQVVCSKPYSTMALNVGKKSFMVVRWFESMSPPDQRTARHYFRRETVVANGTIFSNLFMIKRINLSHKNRITI